MIVKLCTYICKLIRQLVVTDYFKLIGCCDLWHMSSSTPSFLPKHLHQSVLHMQKSNQLFTGDKQLQQDFYYKSSLSSFTTFFSCFRSDLIFCIHIGCNYIFKIFLSALYSFAFIVFDPHSTVSRSKHSNSYMYIYLHVCISDILSDRSFMINSFFRYEYHIHVRTVQDHPATHNTVRNVVISFPLSAAATYVHIANQRYLLQWRSHRKRVHV